MPTTTDRATPPPLTIELPYPSAKTSLNGRLSTRRRRALAGDIKQAAAAAALNAVPADRRPYFPGSVAYIRCDIRVERYAGAQRRDFGGIIEVLKPAWDAFEGRVYRNDRVVYVGRPIQWDATPTGAGRIFLTFTAMTADEAAAD